MTRRWIWIVVVVIVALVVVWVVRGQAFQFGSNDQVLQTEPAVIGDITATVGATGTVRANQFATLVFQSGGIVEHVGAEPGQLVDEGTLLASLSKDSLSAQVILAEADLIAAERALDDLLHSDLALAQAQLALAQGLDALDTAEYRRRVQQEGFRASQDTIDNAEAKLILAEQQVSIAKSNYDRLSGRSSDDPARALALTELTAARQARDAALRNLNWYTGKPTELDQLLLDADVARAEAQVQDAQRNLDRLIGGPDPDDIAAAEARIAAARATINTASIEAPFSGTVTAVEIKEGDVVNPGSVAFSLADLSSLLVDVQVSEVDINRISLGQSVTLVFDAITDRNYLGEVVEIGFTGMVSQGVVNFQVTVQLVDPDEAVKPGMTAAVNIAVEQVRDALLVPNRAVRLREGDRVVYVLTDPASDPEMVVIQLGASSDLYSEALDSDLRAGDLIVLNPPTQFGENGGFFGGPPR
jgi:HlyD family secretion protein